MATSSAWPPASASLRSPGSTRPTRSIRRSTPATTNAVRFSSCAACREGMGPGQRLRGLRRLPPAHHGGVVCAAGALLPGNANLGLGRPDPGRIQHVIVMAKVDGRKFRATSRLSAPTPGKRPGRPVRSARCTIRRRKRSITCPRRSSRRARSRSVRTSSWPTT